MKSNERSFCRARGGRMRAPTRRCISSRYSDVVPASRFRTAAVVPRVQMLLYRGGGLVLRVTLDPRYPGAT
eukprot:1218594-Rhodomonas_salina.2